MVVLKKFGFGPSILEWIETVLKNQETCVINGGTTTASLKLQKGARQSDPVSAYLFIIAIEILFYLNKIIIKIHNKTESLNVSDYFFFHSTYAEDTTFILKNFHVIETVTLIDYFFKLFGSRHFQI